MPSIKTETDIDQQRNFRTGSWAFQERECITCHRPFLPTIQTQDECTQCLIRPSKKDEPVVHKKSVSQVKSVVQKKPKISIKTQTTKQLPLRGATMEKTCIDCKKPYESTSNVQKRCPECIKIHKKQKPSVKPNRATSGSRSDSVSNDGQVLAMLVAAGFVTQEKIDKTREIIETLGN
jgi:hypothetical protein